MISGLYDRRLGLGELFVASWRVFKNNIKYLFVLGFLLAAVFKGLDYLTFILLPSVPDNKIVVGQLKTLVTAVFGFLPHVSVVFIIRQRLASQQVSLAEIVEFLRKIFWPAFLIHMLSQLVSSLYWLPETLFRLNGVDSVLVNFLQFVFILVGLSSMVYFAFIFQAFVLRKQTGFSAFSYSFRTVKGRWWKILGAIILGSLIPMIPCFVVVAMLGRIIPMAMTDRMYWAGPFFTFFGMYSAIFITILFLNIDRRNHSSCPSS